MAEEAPQTPQQEQTDRASQATDREALLRVARARFRQAEQAEAAWRAEAREDFDFLAGAHWPDAVEAQRSADGRPCLTINQLPQFVRQVVNEERQNRPTITVQPVDDQADVPTAEVIEGLIRQIQTASNADIAYDTAAEGVAACGKGYLRVNVRYVSAASFDQEPCIERILNPLSVYLDPTSTDPTAADANWAFIVQVMAKDVYEAQYGRLPPEASAWETTGDTWITPDTVRVAEYYWREWEAVRLALLANGTVARLAQLPEGAPVVQTRTAQIPTVHWAKICGYQVLEQTRWLGTSIPLVLVTGEERLTGKGQRDFTGVVRHAKDPQYAYDLWAPLALDTPLPTPTGWTTMGEVQPGTWLFNESGVPCQVRGVSPVMTDRPCYVVRFSDGTSIIADSEHLWTVEEKGHLTHGGRVWYKKTLPTKWLEAKQHFIWVTDPLDLPKQDLAIDPYVLGVWLGDGSQAEPRITAGSFDLEAQRHELAQCGVTLGHVSKSQTGWNFTLLGLRRQFVLLGLLGNKHIPTTYLRASPAQRLALLQGLMDTDGSITTVGQCRITTVFPLLRDGIAELLRSLGLKAVMVERQRSANRYPNGKGYQPAVCWQFTWACVRGMPLFRLPRKLAVQQAKQAYNRRRTPRHYIVAVEQVPSVPVRCIQVDTPSHLFLAGFSMVPTHNSAEAETIALAPKAPWVLAEGQIEGYEHLWGSANTRNHAYLPYRPLTIGAKVAPPPTRQTLEPPVQAIAQARMLASQDLSTTTGIYHPQLGQQGPPGEAASAIYQQRQQGQLGQFHYLDNLRRSVRRVGQLLVELIPKLYDGPRTLRILGADETLKQVVVGASYVDPLSGLPTLYNLTVGKYDVVVSAGPGYATRRQEAVAVMMQLTTAMPEVMSQTVDLLVKQLDMPGGKALVDRLHKLLPPQLQEGENGQPSQAQQIEQLTQQVQQMGGQLEALNAYAQQSEAAIQELRQRNNKLELQVKDKTEANALKARELEIEREYNAWQIGVKEQELALKAAELQRNGQED